ncbi:Tagatose-6-phosphate kinase [Raoultella terrigena]|uniref:Tagatose-6-phosphate kinase n=1 Tax=Raoultella terrigena TaxID=577 RepID=A0A4V6J2R5_RAOTE|nr:Tagatose-6-phosphate kinase [Raoultella terrigena]
MLNDKTLAGGKGVNVARVLRQLQPQLENAPAPLLLGFLGGATGRLCRELLDEEELEGRWCEIAANTRICEVVTEQKAPDKASVYNAIGPAIQPEEYRRLWSMLATELPRASAVVCTGSLAQNLTPDEYGRWISLAREHGVLFAARYPRGRAASIRRRAA